MSVADFTEAERSSYAAELDEQARRKGVRPIMSVDELQAEVFESDEKLDEFLAELCVTFVTVGELARWAEKRHWGTRARTELVSWLGRRLVPPYDERVAWKWGSLPWCPSNAAIRALSMTAGSLRVALSPGCRWPR